ncbi:MAG: alkaline phosphatase family protein [Polyangiales bacterium]
MKRALVLALGLASVIACRPGAIDWGLGAIDSMKTPPDDPALGCGLILPGDSAQTARASCAFRSGAHADATLGISKSDLARIPIRHVIIAMKENRSFDHVFGKLHAQGQPGVEPIPAGFSNPDLSGKTYFPAHATTTCIPWDPGHQSQSMLACVNGGKMDGFVINAASTTGTDGAFAMHYYEAGDLPFYYFLASTFAIADRHFSPMPTGTFANRDFMMFGTAAGVVDTGITYPPPSTPSIFQLLMSAGFTWGAYTDGDPFSSTLGWKGDEPGVHSTQALYDALDQGTLPNVAFVDGVENIEDDHPDGDLQFGEQWLKKLYDHAIKSPQWGRLVIFFTYDEGGGFMDHVPPPEACRDDPSSLPVQMMGPRVPLVAISPWAKRNYVSHVVHDHTAITRFVEAIFDLPALTGRDASSDALLDLFDFRCGRDLAIPPAPEAGTGGCKR